MNTITRLIFPRDASPIQMTEAIQEIRRKQRKTSMPNPHADKAKELLYHYIAQATGGGADRQEVESIIDEIIDAVHHEIHQELRAVRGYFRTEDKQP